MKISELKQPYRDLAEMRREQQGGTSDNLYERECFHWDETFEGEQWWDYLLNSGQMPSIPYTSLAELEAWRKAKQEANKPETWGKQLYDSGQFHDLLTKYENAEPDYKELYEQRTAQFNELLAKYENPTTSRNWLAECAMMLFGSVNTIPESAWKNAEAWAAEGKKREHL